MFNILINNLDTDTDGMLIKFWNDIKPRVIANMLDVKVKDLGLLTSRNNEVLEHSERE